MTSTVGFGPLARIDGPPRIKPKYGLLQAADRPNSGVRIVTDTDATGVERWGLSAEVYPVLPGVADVFVQCDDGSNASLKEPPEDNPDRPIFTPITIWIAERCKAVSVLDDAAYRDRAFQSFAAVEGAGVEKEILTGTKMPSNSHLADGTGTFPNGDTITSLNNGISLLEAEIAKKGSGGLIHISPQLASALRTNYVISDEGDGLLRTGNGTVVIPGYGYVDGATPRESLALGTHAVADDWEEWIYATGPIDVRRSAVELLPEERAQAFDRGLGATNDQPNTITYIVERHYLVDYDGDIHASVLVDRCATDCGSAPS